MFQLKATVFFLHNFFLKRTDKMSKLPRISGIELIKILTKFFDFRTLRQKGSHITLTNDKVFLTIPLHRELDRGTLLSILRDAGISRNEFLEYI